MNRYELTLILDPTLSLEETQKIVEKVKNSVLENKGKFISTTTWGIRKFATPIKKRTLGYYYFLQFDLQPSKVEKIEWVYRFERPIIRYLLVNLTSDKTYFKQLELNIIKEKLEKKEAKRREIEKASKFVFGYDTFSTKAKDVPDKKDLVVEATKDDKSDSSLDSQEIKKKTSDLGVEENVKKDVKDDLQTAPLLTKEEVTEKKVKQIKVDKIVAIPPIDKSLKETKKEDIKDKKVKVVAKPKEKKDDGVKQKVVKARKEKE